MPTQERHATNNETRAVERKYNIVPTWILAVASMFAVVVLGAIVALTILTIDSRSAVKAQQEASDRTDCARRIAYEQEAIRDARDNAGWRALLAVGLNDDEAFVDRIAELQLALTAVENLEPTQRLVERRCPNP